MTLNKVFKELVLDNFKSDFMIILTYNLLCAVNFLHKVGIMHRDLRPSNVLLNNLCEIQLFNFGSAKDFDEKGNLKEEEKHNEKNSEHTNEISRINTCITSANNNERGQTEDSHKITKRQMSPCMTSRWYRSPEVILEETNSNKKSDIWSMGCLISEISVNLAQKSK